MNATIQITRKSITAASLPRTVRPAIINSYGLPSRWASLGSTPVPNVRHSPPSFRAFCTSFSRPQILGKIELKRMPVITHEPGAISQGQVFQQTGGSNQSSNDYPKTRPTIWKPFVFCSGLSLLGFGAAVYMTNRETSSKIDHVVKHHTNLPRWVLKLFSGNPAASAAEPNDLVLLQLRKLEKSEFLKRTGLNQILPSHVCTWFVNLREGKQICLVLAMVNGSIFALWQLPRMVNYMATHFSHNPLSGRSYTILTSTFSHASTLHLAFNMMALYSIGSTAHDALIHRLRMSRDPDPVQIPECSPTYHFLAFYLFAGLLAGFGSHAHSLLIRAPRLLKWRQGSSNTTAIPTPILPSLGASGAIYGCLTMTALSFPEAHVSLLFLPWIPLKIGGAVTGAVLIDLVGVIRNWQYFDHVAHLCGAFAGVVWYVFITKWFDVVRLKFWEKAKKHKQDP